MFEAFAERDYRRFWVAQFISNIGSWMQGLAQGWLVYHLTADDDDGARRRIGRDGDRRDGDRTRGSSSYSRR